MKGAIAELSAKKSNTANKTNPVIIGSIHQRWLFQRKENSSATIPERLLAIFARFIMFSSDRGPFAHYSIRCFSACLSLLPSQSLCSRKSAPCVEQAKGLPL